MSDYEDMTVAQLKELLKDLGASSFQKRLTSSHACKKVLMNQHL